jgi:hypothetical protein
LISLDDQQLAALMNAAKQRGAFLEAFAAALDGASSTTRIVGDGAVHRAIRAATEKLTIRLGKRA